MSNRRTYVRVYDDLYDHPAWMDLEPEHVGLWVLALGYCSRNLTDGVLPAKAVRRWGGTPEQVSALVDAGRLHEPGHDCTACLEACPGLEPGSLYVHDYLEHQRSREDAMRLSEKRAAAGRAGGKARHAQAPDLQGKQGAKQSAKPAAGNLETETETETKKDTPAAAAAGDFEAWWSTYPHKVGKAAAAKAYAKAHKQVGAEVLAAGLAASIDLWRAERRERQYLPHPTTWLNQGRWADEHPTLEATPDQPARPSVTANLCDGTACPGTRHEWTDASNRYVCMGVAA